MSREKSDYRIMLERLDEVFPNKEMLSMKDLMSFTGMSRNAIIQDFQIRYKEKNPLKKTSNKNSGVYYIAKAVYASHLCG